MTNVVDFAEIVAETPVLEEVTARYEAIAASLNDAQTQSERENALQQWEKLRRHKYVIRWQKN
jgi:hypothetical protein